MKTRPPAYVLKALCPECEQGSALELLTCTGCNKVIVACAEEGTVLADPKDLSMKANESCDLWSKNETTCPHCKNVTAFRLARSDEIDGAGIKTTDYE